MIALEKYDADTSRVLITSDFPMRDKELLKSLPGSKYDLRKHVWTAPMTWATCQAMRGMFGEQLQVGPKLTEWVSQEWSNRIQPALAARQAWNADGDEDLYPFQRAGVQFLASAQRAMLNDEMGTGKTPQTIRTMMELTRRGKNPFPALVVAPNNMVLTWKAELEKWWPGIKVGVLKGGVAQRKKVLADSSVHVFVINFEGVRSHSRLAPYGSVALKRCYECDPMLPKSPQFAPSRCEVHLRELNRIDLKTIVVDEAHRMKDPKAKQSRAIKALRTASTDFVYCLSGTPIADSPIDLFPALHLIDPESFPSRVSYIDRYCQTSFNIFGGMTVTGLNPSTKDEFFRIVDPISRRMPKEAVLPFLPKKQYSKRSVEMSAKQAKAYKQMDEQQLSIVGQDQDAILVAANPLVALTRMVQFSSAFAEMDPDTGQPRLSLPSCKVDALLEWADDNPGEPAVVFAQSRQLIELAADALRKRGEEIRLIVGGQDVHERQQAKDDFQEGRCRFILCTIQAGGIGITLTRSKVAIFLQRSWSMVDNKQAEDRVHRIGSEIHDKIEIIDFVASGTVEEAQQLALAGKLERLEELMRDRETVERVLAAREEEMASAG